MAITPQQEAEIRALLAKGNQLGQQASQQTGVAFQPAASASPSPAPQQSAPSAPAVSGFTGNVTVGAQPQQAPQGTPGFFYVDTPQGREYYSTKYNPAGERINDPATLQEIQQGKITVGPKPQNASQAGTGATQAPLGSQQLSQQLAQEAQRLGVPNVPQNLLQGSPQQTGAQAQQGAQGGALVPGAGQGSLQMPANGSVVDLLNMAGQDSSFAARQQLAQQFGIPGYTGTAAQNTELASKYIAAHNASSGAAPQSGAEGRTAVEGLIPVEEQAPNPQQAFFSNYGSMNPVIGSLYNSIQSILAPLNDRTSLVEEYNALLASSGIQDTRAELMDINRIMEGTEDDIRDEITHSSGFATESQVQGMAMARNKTLLKKANALTDQLALKQDYVNQIMTLTGLDRAEVDKSVDRALGLTTTLANMQIQMDNAARQNYQSLAESMGWDAFSQLMSQNPAQQYQAEQSLGLPRGTLSNPTALALFTPTPVWGDPYQMGNNYVQMNMETGEIRSVGSTGAGSGLEGLLSLITGKPLTEGERLSAGYAQRMSEADATIDAIGSKFTGGASAIGPYLPNILKSADRQQFEQAQRNFINSVLRRESGAVISEAEFENARQQYFPQPGDTAEVLSQKDKNRQTVINSMYVSGGQLQTPSSSNDPLGIL